MLAVCRYLHDQCIDIFVALAVPLGFIVFPSISHVYIG